MRAIRFLGAALAIVVTGALATGVMVMALAGALP